MSASNIPSMIDWELMDNIERTVWATVFAMRFPDVDVEGAAEAADRCVTAIRLAAPARNPPLDPVTRVTSSAIVMSLAEFAVWYQIELRLKAGRWKEPSPLSSEQIEQAYERFCAGTFRLPLRPTSAYRAIVVTLIEAGRMDDYQRIRSR